MPQSSTAKNTVASKEIRNSFMMFFIIVFSFPSPDAHQHIDQLDACKGGHQATQAINNQVAPQKRGSAHGRNFTPRKASGIKQNDDNSIKNDGGQDGAVRRSRSMMFKGAISGKRPINMAGMIAKYLATSLAILKVVSAPG